MSEIIVQDRASPQDLIGSFRRFGPHGTAYEILNVQGERATIRVVESGETLEYPVKKLLLDPVA